MKEMQVFTTMLNALLLKNYFCSEDETNTSAAASKIKYKKFQINIKPSYIQKIWNYYYVVYVFNGKKNM